jgi:hypothetical protein
MDTRIELSFRDRAILRAVAGGRAELLVGVEPDLYLDGRFCADQVAAHRLARAGLIVAAAPGTTAHRVPACLTATGRRHALGAWSPCPATASGDDQPAGRLQPIRRLAVTATGGETTSDYDFVAVSEVAWTATAAVEPVDRPALLDRLDTLVKCPGQLVAPGPYDRTEEGFAERGAGGSGTYPMTVRFRLLGEVEVLHDERRVDVGHDRQRCVLATLLVEVNRPVTVDQLIDRVWADRPPYRARNALSAYMSRLRRQLAGVPGVRIDVVTSALDAGAFIVLTPLPYASDISRFAESDGRQGTYRDGPTIPRSS